MIHITLIDDEKEDYYRKKSAPSVKMIFEKYIIKLTANDKTVAFWNKFIDKLCRGIMYFWWLIWWLIWYFAIAQYEKVSGFCCSLIFNETKFRNNILTYQLNAREDFKQIIYHNFCEMYRQKLLFSRNKHKSSDSSRKLGQGSRKASVSYSYYLNGFNK